ncbi:arrestin domain-containing protein 3-like [Oratosquilla oratoria]|uniref:arrestin domain-containing protein 3-like n=1 Tax=Oratosquilla oratoria TaxID=337810 RepID=UPI003F75D986
MPTNINVILDHPDFVYFPGQTITGRIQLTNTSPKNCRGVKVKFKGYSKVHWTESEKEGDKQVTRHYRSSESYYNTNYYVWGNGSECQLPPGNHTFNFSFMLPPSLPSSFESEHGRVRHEVSAALDLPMASDKECKKFVSVSSLYDLNTIPGVNSPVQRNETKHLCCWCCKSGPISVVLNIDKTGFVSGESMPINAECTNMSNRCMNKTKAKIVQKVTCYAEGKSKSATRTVASLEHPSIPEGESDIWSGVLLKIPPLAPSELPGCPNIIIEYTFEFSMDPGGMAFDLDIEFPITIGTIPLRNAHQNIMVAPGSIGYPAPPAAVPTVPVAPPAGLVAPDPDSQHVDENSPLCPSYPPAPGGPPGYPSAPGAQPGYNPSPSASFAPGAPPGYPDAPGAPPGFPGAPGAPPGYPGAPGAPGYPSAPPGFSPPHAGGAAPPAPLYFPGCVNYPDMPPPSFDQCVFGPHKISNDSDDEDSDKTGGEFAPRYVTYGFM